MEKLAQATGVRVRDAQVPPPADADDDTPNESSLIEEDLLVEDVSIDGMCGVY